MCLCWVGCPIELGTKLLRREGTSSWCLWRLLIKRSSSLRGGKSQAIHSNTCNLLAMGGKHRASVVIGGGGKHRQDIKQSDLYHTYCSSFSLLYSPPIENNFFSYTISWFWFPFILFLSVPLELPYHWALLFFYLLLENKQLFWILKQHFQGKRPPGKIGIKEKRNIQCDKPCHKCRYGRETLEIKHHFSSIQIW